MDFMLKKIFELNLRYSTVVGFFLGVLNIYPFLLLCVAILYSVLYLTPRYKLAKLQQIMDVNDVEYCFMT